MAGALSCNKRTCRRSDFGRTVLIFVFFSELHSYRNYQTHPTFWNSNFYERPCISEKQNDI